MVFSLHDCLYIRTHNLICMDDCVVVECRQKFFKTFWHTKFKSWMCLLWKMENYYHHFWSVFILTLNILLYHISYKYLQPAHYIHIHVLPLTHWIQVNIHEIPFKAQDATRKRIFSLDVHLLVITNMCNIFTHSKYMKKCFSLVS